MKSKTAPPEKRGDRLLFRDKEKSSLPPCSFPFSLGYRMPAEWEPHEATWLAWPHNEETWPEKLPEVKQIFIRMIEALTRHEKVQLLVEGPEMRREVEGFIRDEFSLRENIVFHFVPTIDAWIRDYGPNFICRTSHGHREVAWVRWRFNAWGGKYESLAQDDRVTEQLAPLINLSIFRPERILEGGSIDTNGLGSCLVTEQCLLNPNRNPTLSREAVEETLRDYLGFTNLIWLGDGIAGDDTDGHIDDIARFVNPTTLVAALEEDPQDSNYRPLQENWNRLESARDQEGRKLAIVPLPMPGRVENEGFRLPASYLNFYIANGVVLVPIFGDPKDPMALEILQNLFPHRQVIGIRSENLVMGLGGIHCVTHEQPR